MRGLPELLLLGVLLAARQGAEAQEVSLPAAPTMRCLTAAADSPQPVYPPDFLRREQSAKVTVTLTFHKPDRAPDVEITDADASATDPFNVAVRRHAAKLRLPCLQAAEAPARLVQEYVFRPDQSVRWRSTDPDEALRKDLLACLQQPRGKPVYPQGALRDGTFGSVRAMLTFTAPDRPPQVETYGPRSLGLLKRSVTEWVEGLRLPCQRGAPLRTVFRFDFRLEDEPIYGFKNLQFASFVRGIKDIGKQTLQFDTTKMACPFNVKIIYLQPYLPNVVEEAEPADSTRTPLLNWLVAAELGLPPTHHHVSFGDTMIFSVPCVQIDIKP